MTDEQLQGLLGRIDAEDLLQGLSWRTGTYDD